MDSSNQTPSLSKSNPSLIIEVILLIAINVGFYLLFSKYDLLEKLYIYSREHENYELDEFLPLSLTISLSLLFFVYLRRRESKKLKVLYNELSVYDRVTGFFNRRYFLELLKTELNRRLRSESQLSIILLKFDKFEELDNTQSKVTAEQAIADVARIVKSTAREIDITARWSEEFLVIMCRDTKLSGGKTLADKILDNFHEFKFPEIGALTASIGVVSAVEEKNPLELMERAEKNVELAVSRGNNQIIATNA